MKFDDKDQPLQYRRDYSLRRRDPILTFLGFAAAALLAIGFVWLFLLGMNA